MRPPLIVIVAFDFYNNGDRIQPTGVYYDRLVTQGYCRPETAEDRGERPRECAAMDTSDAEKAAFVPPVKRKRGRPRKVAQ